MNLYLVDLLSLGSDNIKSLLNKYPNIGYLIDYFNISKLNKVINFGFKNILIDSGAYTAFKKGKIVDIDKLCDSYKLAMLLPNVNTKCVALDVIADKENGKRSLDNYIYMMNKGISCIPVFHKGDDWYILDEYAKLTDYIGLGGLVIKNYGFKIIIDFVNQVINRYPNHKYHLFGINNFNATQRLRVYSCDSLSWRCGSKFGIIITETGEYFQFKRNSELVKEIYSKRYSLPHPLPDNFDFRVIDLINIDTLYKAIVNSKETKIPDSIPMYLF